MRCGSARYECAAAARDVLSLQVLPMSERLGSMLEPIFKKSAFQKFWPGSLRSATKLPREAEQVSINFLLDLRYKAISSLDRFPENSLASKAELSMIRTGSSAIWKSQSTSSSGLPKMEQSFPPVSAPSANTRCLRMEHCSITSSLRGHIRLAPKKSTYKGHGTSLEASAGTMNQRSFNRPCCDAELHFERANRPDRHAF